MAKTKKKKYYIKRTICPQYFRCIIVDDACDFIAKFTKDKKQAKEYTSKKQARKDMVQLVKEYSGLQSGNPKGYYIKEEK